MMQNNNFVTKKYIDKKHKEGCSCNLFIIARNEEHRKVNCQVDLSSKLLDKNCAQENVKCHIQHEES